MKEKKEVKGFNEFNLSKEVLKAIEEMGFEEPTPIQYKTIPEILENKDVIGQAQTGTGKTAAFGIPIIERVDSSKKTAQALVLCPTRELAVQVSEELKHLSKYKKGINIVPIYGGQAIERQIQLLKMGVQIVIGTPGRIIDHLKRKTLKVDNIKYFVLDEADEMLNMGFIEDVEWILDKTPKEKQIVLFSATMPQEILMLAKKYQKNPVFIKVVHDELTVPSVEQKYIEVKEEDKIEVLSRLIDLYNIKKAMVFCNTKRKVDEVADLLQARGYLSEGLHGDMRQSQRNKVIEKFKKGHLEILVATDVAARGLDIENVEVVFNFDIPQDVEYYVHRIGRTARAGKEGKAYSFVTKKDFYRLKDIQKYIGKKIKLEKIPTLLEIGEKRLEEYLRYIQAEIEKGANQKFYDIIERLAGTEYTTLDIAANLLKLLLMEKDIIVKE